MHAHHKIRFGDIVNGFKQSDVIFEDKFSIQWVIHSTLETRAALLAMKTRRPVKIVYNRVEEFSYARKRSIIHHAVRGS